MPPAPRMPHSHRRPEVPERSEGHRKSAVADLRARGPISGKPEIGGRSGAVHPSRLAALAPQDDGLRLLPLESYDRSVPGRWAYWPALPVSDSLGLAPRLGWTAVTACAAVGPDPPPLGRGDGAPGNPSGPSASTCAGESISSGDGSSTLSCRSSTLCVQTSSMMRSALARF